MSVYLLLCKQHPACLFLNNYSKYKNPPFFSILIGPSFYINLPSHWTISQTTFIEINRTKTSFLIIKLWLGDPWAVLNFPIYFYLTKFLKYTFYFTAFESKMSEQHTIPLQLLMKSFWIRNNNLNMHSISWFTFKNGATFLWTIIINNVNKKTISVRQAGELLTNNSIM